MTRPLRSVSSCSHGGRDRTLCRPRHRHIVEYAPGDSPAGMRRPLPPRGRGRRARLSPRGALYSRFSRFLWSSTAQDSTRWLRAGQGPQSEACTAGRRGVSTGAAEESPLPDRIAAVLDSTCLVPEAAWGVRSPRQRRDQGDSRACRGLVQATGRAEPSGPNLHSRRVKPTQPVKAWRPTRGRAGPN